MSDATPNQPNEDDRDAERRREGARWLLDMLMFIPELLVGIVRMIAALVVAITASCS